MKVEKMFLIIISAYAVLASGIALAEDADKILLDSFHEYGITKCDKFILEKSKLKSNWNFFISKHPGIKDSPVKEASIIQIFGSSNDTVKTDQSYMQTKNACFVHDKTTVTYSGSCSEHVDANYWYVSTAMSSKDYTEYANKGGVKMYAKEITVGNFKACIQEIVVRNTSPHS